MVLQHGFFLHSCCTFLTYTNHNVFYQMKLTARRLIANDLGQMQVTSGQSAHYRVIEGVVIHAATVLLHRKRMRILLPFINMLTSPKMIAVGYYCILPRNPNLPPFQHYIVPYLVYMLYLLTLGAHAQEGYGTWSVCVSVHFPVLPCRTFRDATSGTSGFSGTMAVELKRRFS